MLWFCIDRHGIRERWVGVSTEHSLNMMTPSLFPLPLKFLWVSSNMYSSFSMYSALLANPPLENRNYGSPGNIQQSVGIVCTTKYIY